MKIHQINHKKLSENDIKFLQFQIDCSVLDNFHEHMLSKMVPNDIIKINLDIEEQQLTNKDDNTQTVHVFAISNVKKSIDEGEMVDFYDDYQMPGDWGIDREEDIQKIGNLLDVMAKYKNKVKTIALTPSTNFPKLYLASHPDKPILERYLLQRVLEEKIEQKPLATPKKKNQL